MTYLIRPDGNVGGELTAPDLTTARGWYFAMSRFIGKEGFGISEVTLLDTEADKAIVTTTIPMEDPAEQVRVAVEAALAGHRTVATIQVQQSHLVLMPTVYTVWNLGTPHTVNWTRVAEPDAQGDVEVTIRLTKVKPIPEQ